MMSKLDIHGWLVLNKPCGITSARAVSVAKKTLNARKLGHAGTLDPLASGVLPLALGEATKTSRFLVDASKEYEFTVQWGSATSTDDCEGEVVATSDVRPARTNILQALSYFEGEIEQTPPIYSAIKVDGRRAYDLARKGEEVALKSRKIQVYTIKLLSVNDATEAATFSVCCGKGTYIRSLARDLAEKLGTRGHVTHLLRTRVGPFCIKDAILLEKLEKTVYNPSSSGLVLPVERVLDDIPVLRFAPEEARVFKQGQKVCLADDIPEGTIVSVRSDDKLLAIGQISSGYVKPVRVFNI